MNTLTENIIWLRRSKNLSQQQLADLLNIKRSTLSAYEQEKATPPISVLQKYAAYFSVDFEQLVNQSLLGKNIAQKPDNLKVLALTVDASGSENIEFVPVKAQAGYLSSYGDPLYIKELPKFQLPFLKGKTYRAFEIDGDSMLPVYSGSIIIGQYVENLQHLRLGHTYIFITQWHGILFKRVSFIGTDKLVLQSDNPLFHSYDLPYSEIKEVWSTSLYMSSHLPEPAEHTLDRIENAVASLQNDMKKIVKN
ncbi:MAG: LexA family transcriptional regulator [Sphingobacteriales bacterium]|nr:MAG: LexA family transcriptional regulator [Sphingobacteriales bacterium]